MGLVLIKYMLMSPQGEPWLAETSWWPAISSLGIGPDRSGPADVDDANH